MTGHLPHPHLPHMRLSDGFVTCLLEGVLEGAFDHLRRPRPVYTDPAAIARWAEWQSPDEWAHRHSGGGA